MSFVGFFEGLDNLVFRGGARGATNAVNQAAQQAGNSWFRPAASEAADTFVRKTATHLEAKDVQQAVHTSCLNDFVKENLQSSEQNFLTSGLMALTFTITALGAGLHIPAIMAAAALGPASWFLGKGALDNQIGRYLAENGSEFISKVTEKTQDSLLKMNATELLVNHGKKLGFNFQ